MALPSGYTQLKYIQSSGTQYIDTGFIPDHNTRLVLDGYNDSASSGWTYGVWTSSTSNQFAGSCNATYAVRYGTANAKLSANVPVGKVHFDQNKNAYRVNDLVGAFAEQTFDCAYSMYLFAINAAGTVSSGKFTGKIYSCQIYDNGTLVRDFVPAKNSGGTVGLYDTVNGVFYTNAGSGAFTAGPSVTGPVDGEGAVILAGVSFAIKEGTAMLNGVARKITEGMTILNGAAKKIAVASGIDVAAMVIGYTGAFSDQKDVVMSGKTYRLLTLTGSGTLSLDREVTADVWFCNGGNGGAMSGYYGGGGGYFKQNNGVTLPLSSVCTIGAGGSGSSTSPAAGGSTSVGSTSPMQQANSPDGASGGGGGSRTSTVGSGIGSSTVPFNETSLFGKHSAGGGGGGNRDKEDETSRGGGAGGSNGADGSSRSSVNASAEGGAGGAKGGGAGGDGTSGSGVNGKAATFYGSGGGGGGVFWSTSGMKTDGKGGAGYQGVIYVRIPYEQ